MFAYIVGAAFASTTYNLFPYFMVGYAAALYRIGMSTAAAAQPQPAGEGSFSANNKQSYGKRQPSLIGTY
jgi:hypothetical protein